MFWSKKPSTTAEFNDELRDVLSRARLNRVPEWHIASELRSYAASIERIAKNAQEARAMRPDGLHKPANLPE
jgi:hypothetical protein